MSKKSGFIDRVVSKLGMNEDEDDGYYDEEDYYDGGSAGNIEPFRKSSSSVSSSRDDNDYYDEPEKDLPQPRAKKTLPARTSVSSRSAKKNMTAGGMEVCVIRPTSMEDAREVTETLLANQTVVLNLEGIDNDIAQRIIDFTSGSTYAIQGNLQKISRYIFIITPASVNISGDFQELLSGSLSQGGPQRFD